MSRLTYDQAVWISDGDERYVRTTMRLSKQQQWGFVMSSLGYIRVDGKMINIDEQREAFLDRIYYPDVV